jgi:hypothetical protein
MTSGWNPTPLFGNPGIDGPNIAGNSGEGTNVALGATIHSSGLWYCELLNTGSGFSGYNSVEIGFGAGTSTSGNITHNGYNAIGIQADGALASNSITVETYTFTAATVFGWAIDFTHAMLWVRANTGDWNNSGTADPSTNTGGISIANQIAVNGTLMAVGAVAQNPSFTARLQDTTALFTNAPPAGFSPWSAGPATDPTKGMFLLAPRF